MGYYPTLTWPLAPSLSQLLSIGLASLSWSYLSPPLSLLPSAPLAEAEATRSSSNLQPRQAFLLWSPGACSIQALEVSSLPTSPSAAFPQGDSSLLPLPEEESWGQLLRFKKNLFSRLYTRWENLWSLRWYPDVLWWLYFFIALFYMQFCYNN